MNSGTAQVIADTALDLLTELGFSIDLLRNSVDRLVFKFDHFSVSFSLQY